MHPDALYAPPSGTTTFPETPFLPTWMCACVGLAIPVTPLKLQHTVPFDVLRCTTARPLPSGSPFGTSLAPFIFAETTGLIELPAASASAGTTSATSARASSVRMLLLSSGLRREDPASSPTFDRRNLAHVLNLQLDQNGYGASAHAAAAYQRPNSRLATPIAGTADATAEATGRADRVQPKPEVRRVIDTAVNSARTRSAATAAVSDGIAARRRTPTPALPPMPCTSPIPKAPAGVRTACACSWSACTCGWRSKYPWRQRTRRRSARKTMSAATAVSALCWTRSGR